VQNQIFGRYHCVNSLNSKSNILRISFFATLCLILFIACSDDAINTVAGPVELTEDEQSMVDKLFEVSIEVDTQALEIEDDALGWLDDLAEKRVVGLGEATHGTKEFFEMKGRIFSYLADNHRFKAFGFEADFAESFYINRYVQGGSDDIESTMVDRMHFWTWRTTEVSAVLKWMRNYNEVNTEESPVQYIGFDCQFMTYQPILLKAYLQTILPGLDKRIEDAIAPILIEDESDFKSVTESQHEIWQDSLRDLERVMDGSREILIVESDAFTFEMHKHLLRSLAQVLQSKYFAAQSNNSYNWRDNFMAENILWYQNLLGFDQKLCVWAHNAHVANNPNYGGGGAMGHHLKNALQADYAVIAFGFTNGRFTAVRKLGSTWSGLQSNLIYDSPPVRSFNFIFDRVPMRAFTVDLELLREDATWREHLMETRSFLEVGSVFNGNPRTYYRQVDLDNYYDRVIYYKRTAAAEQL